MSHSVFITCGKHQSDWFSSLPVKLPCARYRSPTDFTDFSNYSSSRQNVLNVKKKRAIGDVPRACHRKFFHKGYLQAGLVVDWRGRKLSKAISGIAVMILLISMLTLALNIGGGYVLADGSWNLETVDSTGEVGLFTSMALDSSDNPHISYYDYSSFDLKYAHYNGTSWNVETVDSTGNVGLFTSIALDSTDNPHISYTDGDNSDLKYAYYNGASWNVEMVDSTGYVDDFTSIALDSGDNPHISYNDGSNVDLKYAYHDSASWNVETVDGTGNVGLSSSIVIDSGDNPHISYYDDSNFDLKYAYHNGTSWNTETADSTGNVGLFTSIALDSTDNPHISHHDGGNGDLKYTHYNGTSWNAETVDSAAYVGECSSIALDSSDNPHISYTDGDNSDLKYAHYSAPEYHDIAINDVFAVETVVGQNFTAIVMNIVENQGNSTETFNLTAYYDGMAIYTEQWSDGTHSQTFWSMGDAVRDGYIDLWDLDLIASEYGWIGPAGKNPADINSDGMVNTQDVITATGNFGLDIWTFFGILRVVRDKTVVTLPSGHVAVIAFRWNTTNVNKGDYVLSANASYVPGETDLVDNSLVNGAITVAMIGDINGPTPNVPDGKCDMRDIGLVAQAFGLDVGADITNPGPGMFTWLEYWHMEPEPNCPHNPNCDLNGDVTGVPDGKINMKDIGLVASRFGETDP
jgi:hypothetical protein